MKLLKLFACAGLVASVMVGCNRNAQRDRELQSVAKDWSTTIRASQVIPVYPMVEDLQVGDVFLVQRTVEEQHAAYLEKGFLPFENHLARLKPLGYDAAYGQSFFEEKEVGSVMPRFWLAPSEPESFTRAPAAAFPAYTFSVSRGGGFSAALPIQGVPVGLSLLDSHSAIGSVTLKDARTYGLPIMDLADDVRDWARQGKTQATLSLYAPHKDASGKVITNYIRVVSRVYLVGKVGVTLSDTSSRSGGLDVGVPKPVELPLLAPPADTTTDAVKTANTESYKNGLKALNDALAASEVKDAAGKVLPGATLKVVSSSARSVSIDETFKRPVVVGYLGFDMAIRNGGLLGPPCPTFAVLERGSTPSETQLLPGLVRARAMQDIALHRVISALAASDLEGHQEAAAIRDNIEHIAKPALPETYPAAIWTATADGGLKATIAKGQPLKHSDSSYRTLRTYNDQLHKSANILSDAARRIALSDDQKADLEAAKQEINRLSSSLAAIDLELDHAYEVVVH